MIDRREGDEEALEAFEALTPEPVRVMADERGALWKAALASAGSAGTVFREVYVVTLAPGAVRGEHFHRETAEWFIPLKGKVEIRIEHTRRGWRKAFVMDGARPARLFVPPGIAHRIANHGDDEARVLAVADREYDPSSPDSVPFVMSADR